MPTAVVPAVSGSRCLRRNNDLLAANANSIGGFWWMRRNETKGRNNNKCSTPHRFKSRVRATSGVSRGLLRPHERRFRFDAHCYRHRMLRKWMSMAANVHIEFVVSATVSYTAATGENEGGQS